MYMSFIDRHCNKINKTKSVSYFYYSKNSIIIRGSCWFLLLMYMSVTVYVDRHCNKINKTKKLTVFDILMMMITTKSC